MQHMLQAALHSYHLIGHPFEIEYKLLNLNIIFSLLFSEYKLLLSGWPSIVLQYCIIPVFAIFFFKFFMII